MAVDLSVDLIQATVQVEQPLGDGTRTVGTGFLVSDPTPDGRPRVVLITANHVFRKMPGPIATIGFRIENADGSWRYDPEPLKIRDGAKELWVHHPDRDIAIISIEAPPAFAKAAIPKDWLAGDDTFSKANLSPGDQMLALGFPEGLSANAAGFPILRSGRVASFPLSPATAFPTFLLDFNVFPGNSGGPVYVDASLEHGLADATKPEGFIAGMLTQQVELNSQNLSIGIVTHAKYIREALTLLDNPNAVVAAPHQVADASAPVPGLISAEDAAYSR